MHMPEPDGDLEDLEGYEPGFDSTNIDEPNGTHDSSSRGPFGPDLSDRLVELGVDDFPMYFSERDGRLFQSSHFSPYPLPVDTAEQQRLNVTHGLIYQLLGPLYVGPVRNVIQNRSGLVLDLCTGTGRWVLDMAAMFPQCFFRGVDIVPIATRYPPANVQFEMHDVNNRLRWDTSSVDVVHIRDAWMAVSDFPALLREAARVLRPGGLFISCEWGQDTTFHPDWFNGNPSSDAPHSRAFFEAVREAFQICRGILPTAPQLPALLTQSGLFGEITPQISYMPIGSWPRTEIMEQMGRAYRAALRRYADSVKTLLYDAGWSDGNVEALIHNFKQELMSIEGLVGVLYTVHAKRL